MYNENIKRRYIIDKESNTNLPAGYLERQFKKVENLETRLGKDVSCFTVYEILDFYKTLNIPSVDSLTVLNSHLSLYTHWCLQQNLVPDCQNHFMEIDIEHLLECINTVVFKKSIVTKQQVKIWMDQLVNPSDAFIMLALFEGIKGKEFCELVNLKMSDFKGNKVKLCTGKEITVSDDLIAIAQEANDTYTYIAVAIDSSRKFTFLNEDLIIKNYPNCQDDASEFQKGRRIYRRMLRNFEYLGIAEWMRPNSLAESGKIHYINNRCKELNINAEEFLNNMDYIKEVEERFDFPLGKQRVRFFNKYKEYLV